MNSVIPPVEVQGRLLKTENDRVHIIISSKSGTRADAVRQFLVRGVYYQRYDTPQPIDPITDEELPRLQHDVSLFQELGVNTILVPTIDNTKSRTQAMNMLAEAGIYVLFCLSTPQVCIRRSHPRESYNENLMAHYFQSIDAMSPFPNTFGVLVADLLINNDQSLACAPVLAAVVRDVKRHMTLRHQRSGERVVQVGYGGASTSLRDKAVMEYLSSGDIGNRIDFWTCACFSWAGESDMQMSGYNHLIQQYRNANIPIFFSEYGAALGGETRSFHETRALFSPEMTQVFSGGCVYEMWNGANRYGLAQLIKDGRSKCKKDIVESRQTEFGELVLYKDFFHYKAGLEATKEVVPSESERFGGAEEGEGGEVVTALDQWRISQIHGPVPARAA